MKTFLKILAIVVITIIVIALGLLAYVVVKNPFGVGDVIKSSLNSEKVTEEVKQANIEKNEVYDHPYLNEEQEQKLIDSGVDLDKIPTEITAEQEQCGIDKLGQDRINEIAGGSQPTSLEIIKLLPCAN